jgi:hypothetical protein
VIVEGPVHGWDDSTDDNNIAEGDTLFLTCTVESSMEVAIFGSNMAMRKSRAALSAVVTRARFYLARCNPC